MSRETKILCQIPCAENEFTRIVWGSFAAVGGEDSLALSLAVGHALSLAPNISGSSWFSWYGEWVCSAGFSVLIIWLWRCGGW